MSNVVVTTLRQAPVHRITGINFSLLSDEEIVRYSHLDVDTVQVYTKRQPAAGGINDLRLGCTDRHTACSTCGNSIRLCPGHCGSIKLAQPIFHSAFLDVILKTLRSVCFFCARLRGEVAPSPHLRYRARLCHVYSALRSKRTCAHCGGWSPNYEKQGCAIVGKMDVPDAALEAMHPRDRDALAEKFTAATAYEILQAIPDDDLRLMGFDPDGTHPKSMILSTLLVPPPIIRPSVMNDARSRGQDDLSQKYQEINKHNDTVRRQLPAATPLQAELGLPPCAPDTDMTRVQNDVASLYHNNPKTTGSKPSTQRSGAPLKTIRDRLAGKEGRVRGNLLGKRVNSSARSVISPDPRLTMCQLGVPHKIARKLTYPVRVTRHNIRDLWQRVQRGAGRLDGAATVITQEGNIIDLEHCHIRDTIKLRESGDIVERYLQDDDVVIFNRQPSLHASSMMSHRVKLLHHGDTFRLNILNCTPYNADFDGDEMNMYVPQSELSRTEAAELMTVAQNLLSARDSKLTMGFIQDALVGVYLMTADDVTFTRMQYLQLLVCADSAIDVSRVARRARYTPHELISEILPPICYANFGVEVMHGKMLRGRLDKRSMGSTATGIPCTICADVADGKEVCLRFLSQLQNIVDEYLHTVRGFSCGISDCIISPAARLAVQRRIDNGVRYAEDIESTVDAAIVTEDVKEGCVMKLLSGVWTGCSTIVERDVASHNRVLTMVNAGSKGNTINTIQIMACVGQNCVNGKRLRSHTQDASCVSKGFVVSSYSEGLTVREFFQHCMGGREGLVDTAVKTASTGYMQRRLVKAMESTLVFATPSPGEFVVSTTSEKVVSFCYGATNVDPSMAEKVSITDELHMSDDDVRRLCAPHHGDVRKILQTRDGARRCLLAHGAHSICTHVYVCTNMRRQVLYLRRGQPEATPDEIRAERDTLIAATTSCNAARHVCLQLTILFHLRTANVLARKTSLASLRRCCEHVRTRFHQAMICAGAAVGVICGQSIGEPLTQMTLNTFHYSGVVDKNVTLGVPRIKELIDLSKTIKSPLTTFRLLHGDDDAYACLTNRFKRLRLRDIVTCESVGRLQAHPYERTGLGPQSHLMRFYRRLHSDAKQAFRSAFTIFYRLDRRLLDQHSVDLSTVVARLEQRLDQQQVLVLHSSPLDLDWGIVVLVKPVTRSVVSMRQFSSLIQDKVLANGYTQISHAVARPTKTLRVDSGGAIREDASIVIDMYGAALDTVFLLRDADASSSSCNDIFAVYNLLGIEAAVFALLQELTFTLSFDGTYINDAHVLLMANFMTQTGAPVAMSRHGVNRRPDDPLSRCAFEETMDVLCEAAAFSMHDNCRSITASMMLGQPAACGSGMFRYMWNKTVPAFGSEFLRKDLTRQLGNSDTVNRGVLRSRMCRRTVPKDFVFSRPGNAPDAPSGTGNPYETPTVFANSSSSSIFSPDDMVLSFVGGRSAAAEDESPLSSPRPGSPEYHPTSPNYNRVPLSPEYSPSSPMCSPPVPAYRPTSPDYNPFAPMSPAPEPALPETSLFTSDHAVGTPFLLPNEHEEPLKDIPLSFPSPRDMMKALHDDAAAEDYRHLRMGVFDARGI